MDVRTVSFLDISAWFSDLPPEMGAFLAWLLREVGTIYGDEECEVDSDRYRMPRLVVEGMEPYLSNDRGPDFRLRVSELAESELMEHIGRQPRWPLHVRAPRCAAHVSKEHFEIAWRPPAKQTGIGNVRIKLSFGWALRAELARARSLVDHVFERFAAMSAMYACADPMFAQTPLMYSGLPPEPLAWSFGRPSEAFGGPGLAEVVRRGFIRGASWRMLLGPMHMPRLGGRDSFRAELGGRKGGAYGPSIQVREVGVSHLEVTLMGTPRDPSPMVWFGMLGRVSVGNDLDVGYMDARLAHAGLLVWQMPELLSLVDRSSIAETTARPKAPTPRPFGDSAAYMAHLLAHPPRSIREVAVKPKSHELKWVAKHIGTHVTAFVVGPKHGEMLHQIWTKSPKGTTARMKSPILVGGPTRSSAHFVFDAERDGWEGQQNDRPPTPLQGMVPFACPDCGHDTFRALAIFWYDDEDEWVDEPEMISHVEDYFHWFTLRVTCGRCKLVMEGASIECA